MAKSARKDPYNVGSNFDWSIIDNAQISDDQKEAIKEAFANEIKANQRGRTEAQERAAQLEAQYQQLYGNYNQVAQQAQRFEQWRQANQPYLSQWGEVVKAYDQQRSGGNGNGAQQAQAAVAAADRKRKRLTERWEGGEISYEAMQDAFRNLDEELDVITGDLNQRFAQIDQRYSPVAQNLQRVQQELPRYGQSIGRLEQELQRLRQENQQNLGSIMPTAIEIARYQIQHPDRDPQEIYRVWAERQLPSFQAAADEIYGEEDQEVEFERKYQERVAAEREKSRRKRESRQQYTNEEEGESDEYSPEYNRPGSGENIGVTWRRPKVEERMRQQAAQENQVRQEHYQAPSFNPQFKRDSGAVRDALAERFFNPPDDEAA